MNKFRIAVRIFIFMTLLTGVIYPFFITLIAQLTMPKLSNGSLLQKESQTLGSLLIAQNTVNDRYFWPRPSAINYNPINPSGGSNLGPTSQKLKEMIEARKLKIGNQAPPELIYASGSGLDPHISLEAAYFQMPKVANARGINETELKKLIDSLIEGKQLGFLGPHYVNVLLLNQALDDR